MYFTCTRQNFLSVSLKEDHTDFNLPGGSVEENETNIECGIREMKEETGLDIVANKLHFLYSSKDGDCYVFTYYTHNYEGTIYTEEDHVVKWLPLEDLKKSKKWPGYNSIIYEKYMEL